MCERKKDNRGGRVMTNKGAHGPKKKSVTVKRSCRRTCRKRPFFFHNGRNAVTLLFKFKLKL